ncbi:MAG: type I restriction-modification system subunit M [Oscillospiraceae bacterium]|nr:type I restriction-modification system subunit M [Oscillospiraceae bacterium]
MAKKSAVPKLTSLKSEIKAICDIMRRSNCAGAMQYVPELTWLLFLRILDVREAHEASIAAVLGNTFTPSLTAPYRWSDWANKDGAKRRELVDGKLGAYFEFVNAALIPHLKSLKDVPEASPRQKVISEILSGVERVRIDTEKNLLDILDKVDDISAEGIDETHIFTMSQVYEELLLKMGEKGNDGGQFFTPREIIRAMVRAIDPKPGESVYDCCCGTGGFLVQAYLYMLEAAQNEGADALEQLKHNTFFGREKENLIYPITLANMVLHGIEQPSIWHGNTLTGNEVFGGLFIGTPGRYDVVLTNPPFGGKEGKEAQTNFAYKTGATQVLFLQHVIDSLKSGGRCGIVLDEGVLFRTNENAFVQTKRKLLDDCNVYAIVSLPGGVFSAAGAGVKTNILLFEKGKRTEFIWYYDLSDIKVGKRTPFTIDKFDDFFRLLPDRGDSDRSWTVSRHTIEDNNFDIKAVNPNRKVDQDIRTPAELIAIIEEKQVEIMEALTELKKL